MVTNLCKGFSNFKESEAYKYAGVESIEEVHTLFPVDTSKTEAVAEVVEKLYCALTDRLNVLDLYGASESTMREFISPVLIEALLIFSSTKSVRMVAGRRLTGSLGSGPVDYILLYEKFNICVVEAKRDVIEAGVNQNLAQIVASREDYCRRKRALDDIKYIPSCGIVSSGYRWVFLRY